MTKNVFADDTLMRLIVLAVFSKVLTLVNLDPNILFFNSWKQGNNKDFLDGFKYKF